MSDTIDIRAAAEEALRIRGEQPFWSLRSGDVTDLAKLTHVLARAVIEQADEIASAVRAVGGPVNMTLGEAIARFKCRHVPDCEAGTITITVPYITETSGFREPRPCSGAMADGRRFVGAVRDERSVLIAEADIGKAVLAAWPWEAK